MSHDSSWEQQGVLISYKDRLQSTLLARVIRYIQADPRHDFLKYVIHDCSHCTGADYSFDDLIELAATNGVAARTNSKMRVAIVTTHREIIALVSAYVAFGLDPTEVQLFPTLVEARLWAMENASQANPICG